MSLRIALATLADLETVLLLMRKMQKVDPWSEPFSETILRADLAELLQNPIYGVIYLAWDADSAVAYLVICFDYSLEYRG